MLSMPGGAVLLARVPAQGLEGAQAGVRGSTAMSLEEARSWQLKVYHSAWLRDTRSSLEVHVGLLVYSYVQRNPFVKAPGPRGTRERDAALSEKQASLRSNVTASGNAQRDDTVAWGAEPTYWPMAQL